MEIKNGYFINLETKEDSILLGLIWGGSKYLQVHHVHVRVWSMKEIVVIIRSAKQVTFFGHSYGGWFMQSTTTHFPSYSTEPQNQNSEFSEQNITTQFQSSTSK